MITKRGITRKIQAVVVGIICVYIFMTMAYVDGTINAKYGYEIADAIFTGTFGEYFHTMDWSYGMTLYLIYAIWSVPVWIIHQIMGIAPMFRESAWMVLWYKLLIVVFAVWSVNLVCRIMNYFEDNDKGDIALHYIGSPIFIIMIFAIGQCDIIGICFVLLGINYVLRDKCWKGIACFAIAVTMKYFALVAIIPILVYKEKTVKRLTVSLVSSMSFMLLVKIILSFSEKASASLDNSDFYINVHKQQFGEYVINLGTKEVSWFAMAFLALCFGAWIASNEKEEVAKPRMIWFAMVGYMLLCLLYPCSPYWIVVMVPFMTIMMRLNKKRLKECIFLELVFAVTLLLCHIYTSQHVVMSPGTYSYTLLSEYGRFPRNNLVTHFFEEMLELNLAKYLSLIRGVLYSSAIIFAIITYPRKQADEKILTDEERGEIALFQWGKILFVYGVAAITLISLFAMYNIRGYNGFARVQMEEDSTSLYEAINCKVEERLLTADEGMWMSDELHFSIDSYRRIEEDLLLRTYGYAMSETMKIEVYVNDIYVGDLQREDESLNTTMRMLVIPKEAFDESEKQVIKMKAEPQMITYEGEEVWISLYMKYLELVAVE